MQQNDQNLGTDGISIIGKAFLTSSSLDHQCFRPSSRHLDKINVLLFTQQLTIKGSLHRVFNFSVSQLIFVFSLHPFE